MRELPEPSFLRYSLVFWGAGQSRLVPGQPFLRKENNKASNGKGRKTAIASPKVSWGLKVIDIEDITRWREDMNFIFEWQNNILRTSAASE